jgi:hypothetical protein
LGKKIKQLVQPCDLLTQQAFSIYDTPSEKIRKSPIINMLMKTVATCMLLRHLLISFILIGVAGHIHFRPISTSLFVSAWFVFSNSPRSSTCHSCWSYFRHWAGIVDCVTVFLSSFSWIYWEILYFSDFRRWQHHLPCPRCQLLS